MKQIPAIFLRTPYNYDANAVSDETGLKCEDPTLAQQQFKEECDINTIVKRFGLTGEMPAPIAMPLTGDFTNAPDYRTALDLMRAADDAFMSLPAEMRRRFDNDPAQLIDFLENPNNRDEAQRLGLVAQSAPPQSAAATNQEAPKP